MPDPVTIVRAELWELDPDNGQRKDGTRVPVQFNPESLKVSYSNQVVPPASSTGGSEGGGSGGASQSAPARDQRGTSAIQFVGKGTTKLTLQLWFDVSAVADGEDAPSDVRRLTQRVANFMKPQPSRQDSTKLVPPA